MSLRPRVYVDDGYLSKVIKYIPTEITAVYVFISGLIASAPTQEGYFKFTFITLIIITPIWIFLAIGTPNPPTSPKGLRIYQSIVALFAMMIWVYNISMPWVVAFFNDFKINLPNDPVAGSILLALFTLIVPILEKIFVKPNPIKNKVSTHSYDRAQSVS